MKNIKKIIQLLVENNTNPTGEVPGIPAPDEKVVQYRKRRGMPARYPAGLSGIGWFSEVPAPLTPESTLEEIHEFAPTSEAGSAYIFNLPHVMEYADQLLEEVTEEEIALLPPISLHTDDLDTLRDEGIAFSKRLAQAGKRVTHVNHIGSTHAMHVYTPIFHPTQEMELSAKAVTAFALRYRDLYTKNAAPSAPSLRPPRLNKSK